MTGFEAQFVSEYTRVREKLITVSGHTQVTCRKIDITVELVADLLPANDTEWTGR